MTGKKQSTSNGLTPEQWTNIDDFYLCEGIYKYGIDEWGRIIKDDELWNRSKPSLLAADQVWKLLFTKIEGHPPDMSQEKESIE